MEFGQKNFVKLIYLISRVFFCPGHIFYCSIFQFLGHGDVGRQFLEPVSNRIDPSSSGPGSLNESGLVEPLDYEEYITQQTRMNRGQTKHNNNGNDTLLVDFPPDDIEVNVVPRKIRTLGHVLPEEPMYVLT